MQVKNQACRIARGLVHFKDLAPRHRYYYDILLCEVNIPPTRDGEFTLAFKFHLSSEWLKL